MSGKKNRADGKQGSQSHGRSLKVAVVGRPNVGKSTLFNRLLGKAKALVADVPGVTRDWKSATAVFYGIPLTLIDTAGQAEKSDDTLQSQIQAHNKALMTQADIVLWMVDGQTGVLPDDLAFAEKLRRIRSTRPVLLVLNKCEGKCDTQIMAQAYGLGFGDPYPISAIHGDGLTDLATVFADYLEKLTQAEGSSIPEEMLEEHGVPPLSLAVLGRPNVGKSTLINQLMGQERLLTGPQAGVTRDAIELAWTFQGKPVKLVDTAGLRKKGKINHFLEKMATQDSLQAIRFAHVVVLVLDASEALEKQDLTLADYAVKEGRGLILAFNKWDRVESPEKTLKQLAQRVEILLPQVKRLPFFPVCALTGQGLEQVVKKAFELRERLNRRVPTASLNRWLEEVLMFHTPPMVKGRRIKIKYITQIKTRPPTFVLFGNQLDALAQSYQRYLRNQLCDAFDLWEVPLRLYTRQPKNPYHQKKS